MNNENLVLFSSLLTASLVTAAFVIWGPTGTKVKRRNRRVAGLENLGNTCYLNTILQSLAACRMFIKWLEECHFEEHRQLASHLSKLLKAINDFSSDNKMTEIHSPQRVLDALQQCDWRKEGQQDAFELFQFIISELSTDQQRLPSQISLFQPSLLDSEIDDGVCSLKSKYEVNLFRFSNCMEQPFRGSIANHLTCTFCKTKKPVSLSKFDCLTLPVPSRCCDSLTLGYLLSLFTQSELVHDVTCLNCSGKQWQGRRSIRRNDEAENLPEVRRIFTKQMTIGKLPHCLCFHIQRVTWQTNGVPVRKDHYVKFPEHLNMNTFCKNILCNKQIHNQHGKITKAIKEYRLPFIGSSILPNHQLNIPSKSTGVKLNPVDDKGWISSRMMEVETYRRPTTSYIYKLMSAVVHVGDAYSGHFVTYRRAPSAGEELNTDWLCISDGSVRLATISETIEQKAYMLYYQREL